MIHEIRARVQSGLPHLKQALKYTYVASGVTGGVVGFLDGIALNKTYDQVCGRSDPSIVRIHFKSLGLLGSTINGAVWGPVTTARKVQEIYGAHR